ncbi:DUF3768 domain-containing protein [Methylobacterium sp. WL64]|uniref:DUF3768 domain-containing protein n=1 Tax=Methylobacterium sp. WL64 TaxID=2603894 RepID=UPI0011C9D659|nr:DUF3768 domain-containing protein [Methylobacterium sp. WL64]TXM97523.1 DUF3768 domain-containing protein [Methylobacterium sp. WL64]
MTAVLDADRVRALNDTLRRTLSGGTLVLTAGVVALGRARQQSILDAVAAHDRFDADDDPYGEHDFGALEAARRAIRESAPFSELGQLAGGTMQVDITPCD